MADVNLTGDASSLVRAIELATDAFIQFDQTTAKVTRDQLNFNKQGELTSRTLTAIDAAGSKLVQTFRETDGSIARTTSSLKAQTTALNDVGRAYRNTGAAATLAANGVLDLQSAQAQQAAIAAQVVAGQKSIFAGAQQVSEAQRQGIATATQLAEARRAAALGGRTSLSIERLRALRAEVIEEDRLAGAIAREASFRERAIAVAAGQRRARQIAEINAEAQATERLTAARQRTLRGAQGAGVAGNAGRVRAIRAEEAADQRLAQAKERIIQVENRRRTNVRDSVNRLRATRQENIELTRQADLLNQIRFARQGGATAQQIQQLSTQQANLTKEVGRSATAFGNLRDAATNLVKVTGIALFIGSAFRLIGALEEATQAAAEFSIKIAEIQTISGEAARSTEAWAEDLRALSSEFGIDTITQAEAAYQTLSNQIRNASGETLDAAETIRFLESANRLAVTGVTDTANSVSLLSSALNSFRIPAEDADVVAAQLFKTVELGRLRVEDLANIFGRVAVPAQQLGLSIEEVLGSISSLTVQGFKVEEAITGIRNVILKLVKPTEAGQKAIENLGFATGQALIEAQGFIPALESFTQELGNTTEATAEGFGRIRAIVGALGLTGQNAQRTAENIAAIGGATEQAFGQRTQTILQSTGQQLNIIREEAKNLFEREIGTPAIKAILNLVRELGGIENIIRKTIASFKVIAQIVVVFAGARTVGAAVTSLVALRAAFLSTGTAATTFGQRVSAAIPLLQAAAVAATLLSEAILESAKDEVRALEQANLDVLARREENVRETQALVAQQTQSIVSEFNKTTQSQLNVIAKRRAAITSGIRETTAASKEIDRQLEVTTASFNRSLNARISSVKKVFTEARQSASGASKAIERIFEDLATGNVDVSLVGAGTGQQLQALTTALSQAQEEARQATEEGDLKAFERAQKRIQNLSQQRVDAAIRVSQTEVRIERELSDTRLRLFREQDQSQRDLLQNRLDSLQRQQQAARAGSQAELQAQEKLLQLQESLTDASTAEEFTKILTEIQKVRKEQDLIEESARREREIRLQALREQETQVRQLEEIRQKNEERAAQAAARERRLEVARFLFQSISKEADAFNQKQVLAIEDQDELVKQVGEQQQRLARIRSLQTLIGGGAEAEALQRERGLRLQEAAQAELEKRDADSRARRLQAEDAVIAKQVEAAQSFSATNAQAVQNLISNLGEFEQALTAFQSETGPIRTDSPRLNLAERARGAFGAPEGVEGTLRVRSGLTGRTVQDETSRNVLAQENIVNGLRENVSRLQELTQLLQSGPQPQAIVEEFNNRFGELRQTVVDVSSRIGNIPREQLTPDLQAVQDAVGDLLREQATGTPLGALPDVIREDQTRQRQIQNLRDQNRLLEVSIKTQAGQVDETEKATQAIITFEGAIDSAAAALRRRQQIFEAESEAPTAPGLAPLPSAENLTREINEGAQDRAEEAGKTLATSFLDGVATEAPSVGESIGTEAAKAQAAQARTSSTSRQEAASKIAAENDARIRTAPDVERKLAQIRAQAAELQVAPEARRRRSDIPENLAPRQIDTSIRLGAGAPSIRAQEARIQAQLNAEAQRQQEFRRAQQRAQQEERDRARQRARDEGRVGVDERGRLVSLGLGNINREGNLFTRGLGNFTQDGRQVGRSRLGVGLQATPTETRQLSATEQVAQNTQATVDAIKNLPREGAEAAAAEAAGLPAPGTGRINGQTIGANPLFPGEAQAQAELRRLQALRAQGVTGPIRNAPFDPLQSRDPFVRALGARRQRLLEERGIGSTRPRNRIEVAQVSPLGRIAPGLGFGEGQVTVNLTVESNVTSELDGQQVARAVASEVQKQTVRLNRQGANRVRNRQ